MVTPLFTETLVLILAIHAAFFGVLFILSIFLKRNDIADIGWGTGGVLLAISSFLFTETRTLISTVMLLFVFLWGIRLAHHIYKRNLKKSEDARYAAWRIAWGKYVYLRSFFQIYVLQAVLLFLVMSPVILAVLSPNIAGSNVFFFLGCSLWLFGYAIESVADYQLARFKKNPENKGKLLTTGLWKYSRHPNYFGEVVLWWGIGILSSMSIPWYFACIGPLTITYLICFVSGIPMTEKMQSTNPLFEAYKKKTSVFFLLPPKNE